MGKKIVAMHDYAIPVTAFVQASSKQEATKKALANIGHSGVAWDMKDAELIKRESGEGDAPLVTTHGLDSA